MTLEYIKNNKWEYGCVHTQTHILRHVSI